MSQSAGRFLAFPEPGAEEPDAGRWGPLHPEVRVLVGDDVRRSPHSPEACLFWGSDSPSSPAVPKGACSATTQTTFPPPRYASSIAKWAQPDSCPEVTTQEPFRIRVYSRPFAVTFMASSGIVWGFSVGGRV